MYQINISCHVKNKGNAMCPATEQMSGSGKVALSCVSISVFKLQVSKSIF
jgi:hypothetical protein